MAPPWLAVPPPAYGGTEDVIDCLARGFVEAGHEVLLWTTGDATCPVNKGYLFSRSLSDRMGAAALELAHVISGYDTFRAWRPDIVHDHTITGPVYAQRYPELRVVTTNHGPFNAELAVVYQAMAATTPIIAISRDHAARAGDIPIAAAIRHGIDLDRYPPGEGLGDERGPYYLNLSRMSPSKGVHLAVAAAHDAGVRLLIASKMREDKEHEYFDREIAPLLDDDVVYVGEVGRAAKVGLLQRATALVNPIQWPEPFGLVMAEALACATPVIAWADGSAPELVDDGVTGVLCQSYEDLVAAIDKVRSIERAACRADAERRFSRQGMVADHLALFERLRAAPPPKQA